MLSIHGVITRPRLLAETIYLRSRSDASDEIIHRVVLLSGSSTNRDMVSDSGLGSDSLEMADMASTEVTHNVLRPPSHALC